MALIKADRVKETSTSTGNGTFSLAGAATGYRTFSSVCAVGDTFFYGISNQTSGEWETGLGTYSATNTLTRTTVHSSSNSGAIVTFGAGTKEVFLTASAQYLERIVDNGLLTSTGSATSVVAVNDGPQPQLDLAFSADKTLTARYGPTPSYSRASTGTYFNASGVLTSAAINAPRFDHAYENGVWVSKGLLIEEQRTNTALYSSDIGNAYWGGTSSKTANFGISPDGTQNAARITGGGYFQSGGISKTGTQTFSFWAKTISGNSENIDVFLDGGFATTSKTITGSWVRYSVTQTFGSTNTGTIGIYPLSANILFYGPQLEAGVFATSYIPTTTTSVVRSADVCQITGSDFSGFWNATQGSFASEWDAQRNSSGQFTVYWVMDSGSNNTVLHTGRDALSPPGVRFTVVSGASVSAEIISPGFPAVGATTRTAGGYKANDFAYAYNGSLVGTDTSGAVPVSPTQMRIGYDPYTSWLNGHISRLRYFNTRLDNQTLVQLSGGINNLIYKSITGSGNATVTNNYTNINVSVPNPLPVTNGGTGGTTAITAVTNLVGNPPNDGGQYTLASKKTSGTPTFYWVDGTGYAPTLDLLFAADKTLTAYKGPTPSFSRASSGTYFDSTGILRYAVFNMLQNSEDLTNAYWVKSGLSASANQIASPTGTLTADKIIENASSGIKYGVVSGGFSVVSGTTYCFSAYVKNAGRYFTLATNLSGFPNVIGAVFNPTNGTISNIQSNTTASIQDFGNGWYRCSIVGTASSSTTTNINFGITNDLNQLYASYTGDGVSGYYLWGIQMEASSTVGTYVPTTSAANALPRFDHTYNGTSWISRGLLVEEQRTNGIAYSKDFSAGVSSLNATLTTNSTTSPDGTSNAATITATSTVNCFIYVGPDSSSNTIYTVSIYAKQGTSPFIYVYDQWNVAGAWFNLSTGAVGSTAGGATASIVNVGNGWYRCIFTKDGTGVSAVANRIDIGVSDTAGSYAVTNGRTAYIYGIQREVGSFATSYIPTTSSSSTRSADVCQITGSDFSSFWNASEGSVAVEYDTIYPLSLATSRRLFIFRDSGNTVRLNSEINPLGIYWETTPAGASIYSSYSGSAYDAVKVGYGYKLNDFAITANGVAASTDTSVSVPTGITLLDIGNMAGTQYMCGHITRLRYYPARIPNATLQTLST